MAPVFRFAVNEYPEHIQSSIFNSLEIPNLKGSGKKRIPFTVEELKALQSACEQKDDPMRWIIALISDSGLRCAEAVGIRLDEIQTKNNPPHLVIQANNVRPVKTPSSRRKVPLVGVSLWAARRVLESASPDQVYAFPRYIYDGECRATHASNALNKWIKDNISLTERKTLHSLRHTLRDRLRDVSAPSDLANRIGGWTNQGVGEGYGQGHSLKVLHQWMLKIV